MTILRNLILWCLLAAGCALAAHFLLPDPGFVLIRFAGRDYTTTLVVAVLAILTAVFLLWFLWALLSLPFRGLAAYRQKKQHSLLGSGVNAFYEGKYTKAESYFNDAASSDEVNATAALFSAARSALRRDDTDAARRYIERIDPTKDAALQTIGFAMVALASHQPQQALDYLDMPAVQPLPAYAAALRAQAYADLGDPEQAYAMLGALRKQQAFSAEKLENYETQWAQSALQKLDDPNAVATYWEALPKTQQQTPDIVRTYVQHAMAFGWRDAAIRVLEQAIDAQWSNALVRLYGRIPADRTAHRLQRAEQWLSTHPDNPALLSTLALLSIKENKLEQAETYLNQALVITHDDPSTWYAFAELNAASGNLQQAVDYYRHAHTLSDAQDRRATRPLGVTQSSTAVLPQTDGPV